jgi:hypothetical protein
LKFQTKTQIFIVFGLLMITYLFALKTVQHNYQRTNKVINEDAFGYYTILPAYLKYNDPNFSFLDSSVKKLPNFQLYVPPVINSLDNNKKVCKYYSGVAMLQLPFYLVGNEIAKYQNQSIGYESIYQNSILFSVVFYLALALWFFIKSLILIGANRSLIFILGAVALFGTNIYCYTTYDPAYSHVYSMFAFNAFLYLSIRFKGKQTVKDLFIIGLIAGLIIAIRPLNGLIILCFPIISCFNSIKSLQKKSTTLLFLLGFSIAPFIQSYLWFWQTGKWYVYPYVNEHLEFKNPKLYELLLGFDCGWLIYTPLPLTALIVSLILLILQGRIKLFTAILLLSSSVIYIVSCWYYIHYGCTVSCRPLVEYIFPILLLFGFVANKYQLKKQFKIAIVLITTLGILYNQIIHYQFYNQIINWCKMDKEKFKMVFLKTHPYYTFATSDFWNFDNFDKHQIQGLIVNNNLKIDKNQVIDKYTIQLTNIQSGDSSLLLDISLKIKQSDKINESVLTMLFSENEQYLDLHHFLLKRVVKQQNNWTNYQYQVYFSKPINCCEIKFTLESINNNAITDVMIEKIRVSRISLK